jgi:hypothetical protein
VDMNHCQILEKSLSGEREVNEETFASLAILTERLERVKKFGKHFSDVTFSSAVEKLAAERESIAVV